jgi:hypothetical protein
MENNAEACRIPIDLEYYIEKRDWNSVSVLCTIDEIIEKYKDVLNWKLIAYNRKITPEFYGKYEKYLEKYLQVIANSEYYGFLPSRDYFQNLLCEKKHKKNL